MGSKIAKKWENVFDQKGTYRVLAKVPHRVLARVPPPDMLLLPAAPLQAPAAPSQGPGGTFFYFLAIFDPTEP